MLEEFSLPVVGPKELLLLNNLEMEGLQLRYCVEYLSDNDERYSTLDHVKVTL